MSLLPLTACHLFLRRVGRARTFGLIASPPTHGRPTTLVEWMGSAQTMNSSEYLTGRNDAIVSICMGPAPHLVPHHPSIAFAGDGVDMFTRALTHPPILSTPLLPYWNYRAPRWSSPVSRSLPSARTSSPTSRAPAAPKHFFGFPYRCLEM